MRTKVLLIVALAITPTLSQAEPSPTEAQAAALADGATTLAVLQAGGIEANPLLPGSPLGVVGITVVKLAAARLTTELPPEQQAVAQRSLTSMWGGASIANLLTWLGAGGPPALLCGLVAAAVLWDHGAPEPATSLMVAERRDEGGLQP